MTTLISTGIAASVDSLNWLMPYLIGGWVATFGIFTAWTIYSIKLGATHGIQAHGRTYKVYRKKEPKLFLFLVTFYLIMGSTGFVSVLFTLLRN